MVGLVKTLLVFLIVRVMFMCVGVCVGVCERRFYNLALVRMRRKRCLSEAHQEGEDLFCLVGAEALQLCQRMPTH